LSAFHLESQLATLESFVQQSLPSNQAELVMREAARIGARSGLPLVFGMLVSTFYASRGVMAILRGVALAWRRPRVRMWQAELAAGVFGAGMLIFALVLFSALMAANLVLAWFRDQGVLTGGWEVLTLFRWPILLFSYHALVRVTYRVGAGPKWTGRWFSPGSVLATLGWATLSQVFEAYVDGVMNLGATYGSLGSTVGLLLYFHAVSSLIFIGAEVDAHLQCGDVDAHRKPLVIEELVVT
ncbi:MAG: uncharacterized BrkB/YihY/UPF0761 family membrane protein, partial [Bradymonadia bacterium]